MAYLDYYRDVFVRKLDGLSDEQLRSTRLPSGWTPLELLKHVVFVTRRRLRWRPTAEPVEAPWGDNLNADREEAWHVDDAETLEQLTAMLRDGAARTRAIVETAELTGLGRIGGGDRGARTGRTAYPHRRRSRRDRRPLHLTALAPRPSAPAPELGRMTTLTTDLGA